MTFINWNAFHGAKIGETACSSKKSQHIELCKIKIWILNDSKVQAQSSNNYPSVTFSDCQCWCWCCCSNLLLFCRCMKLICCMTAICGYTHIIAFLDDVTLIMKWRLLWATTQFWMNCCAHSFISLHVRYMLSFWDTWTHYKCVHISKTNSVSFLFKLNSLVLISPTHQYIHVRKHRHSECVSQSYVPKLEPYRAHRIASVHTTACSLSVSVSLSILPNMPHTFATYNAVYERSLTCDPLSFLVCLCVYVFPFAWSSRRHSIHNTITAAAVIAAAAASVVSSIHANKTHSHIRHKVERKKEIEWAKARMNERSYYVCAKQRRRSLGRCEGKTTSIYNILFL